MAEDSRYYTILRDPARRKIIEILGEQGKIGFKELKENLGLGVGTVYYHLDMLSDFLSQDKERKYVLNDRGRLLYRWLKEGSLPPSLNASEAFSHKVGRWLFLSPVFAKTTKPYLLLPISLLILIFGALGAGLANVDPLLFFYQPFSSYQFESIVAIFLFNWVGLFLFSEAVAYLFYRRIGNDLQLFVCLGIAAFPQALIPYVYLFFPEVTRYLQIVFQVWTLLLLSSAFCFGKGLRLDRAIIISLLVLYLNIAFLMVLGRFP
ncbi:MAG: winged helix-turn-helix domain-containing protein [Candidatus Bathyarchaeia archaeon]